LLNKNCVGVVTVQHSRGVVCFRINFEFGNKCLNNFL